jgi:hypothetical protein
VIGSKYQVTSDVPPDLSSMQVPERVLQKRLVARGAKTIMQVLIKWSALRETLSTWEDLQAIKQRFPAAPAWGPAVAQEEGVLQLLIWSMAPKGYLSQWANVKVHLGPRVDFGGLMINN